MNANVDKDTCIGCGMCESICPDIFVMDDDGKSKVIVSDVPADNQDEAKDAAEACPVNAITV